VAVTTVAALLSAAVDLGPARSAVVVSAVLTGQLTIGWSNDLLDAHRDRRVRRTDKPLATGELSEAAVRAALVSAALCCVVLSLSLGWRSGLTHLGLVVGGGTAYNLGMKARRTSWVPYAVAFGALPAVVTLAAVPPAPPPWWMVVAGALLGVGAHLMNVLPDLDDDAATGVRGLPHRLGAKASQTSAGVLLVLASLVVVLGPAGAPRTVIWLAPLATVLLAAVVLRGSGRAPFTAAAAIAVIDVALLAAAS
jgi:4-hydroxybenzoate polyprenyltransferase